MQPIKVAYATFRGLPLFGRTAIWVLGFWLITIPGYRSDPKNTWGDIFGALALFALIGFACAAAKANGVKQKVARENSAALAIYAHPEQHLRAELEQMKTRGFLISQWSILPTSFGALGFAVNSENNAFCLLQFETPKNLQSSAVPVSRLISAKDIINSNIEEETYVVSRVTTTTTTTTKNKTSTGSVVGRAVVGGLIAGPAGAVIGGATAKKSGQSTGITTGTQINQEIARSIHLKITLNDSAMPILKLPFLQHEVPTNSADYRSAKDKAEHWQGIIEIAKHRS